MALKAEKQSMEDTPVKDRGALLFHFSDGDEDGEII